MKQFMALLSKDIHTDLRTHAQIVFMPCFFMLLTLLFPLAFGPSMDSLFFIASGLLVLAALLTTLTGFNSLFRTDFENGFLQSVFLSNTSLITYGAASLCGHFLVAGLPLVILSPIIALLLGTPLSLALWPTPFILAVTLLCLTLIGGILRALTLSATQTRPLISLLSIPLFIPPLIFATSALNLSYTNLSYESPLLFLCALTLLFMVVAPYVMAVLLRWSLRS